MFQTHLDLGFEQVRFHGIFADDMSVVLPGDSGSLDYSYYNIFKIYDFLVSIGMKPLIEIGLMPSLLASGNKTWAHFGANVTPPKSLSAWADFISDFVKNLILRYGQAEVETWSFEIWNEPNCCPHDFWSGSMEDYFVFFNWTSRAIKSVDPNLKVGGPTTAMSAWIDLFLAWNKNNNVPFDFISTHEYPTDPPGPQSRTFFRDALQKTRDTVGKDMPIFYTEYDDGYNDATSYAAAFAVFTIYSSHGIVDLLSWWPFSDIFEEQGLRSNPFSDNGWLPVAGLQNIYGIPKPSYRAFQLLHWTGNQILKTTPDFYFYQTASVFAVGGNHTSIFVINWDVKPNPIAPVEVTIEVFAVDTKTVKAVLYAIDDNHVSAYQYWVKIGKPFYLTPDQVQQCKMASELVPEPLNFSVTSSNSISFTLTVPPQAVYNVVLL
uniref:Glycosyl hydrolases family 39 N-terminal catalytic domain-containing protein n=1 Tax=Arcella intermedia TaxID=1963864 RepID=A0A6B2L3E8_9EUKA